MTSSLADIIRLEIQQHGPITIERYMDLALMHPQFGYYQRSEPFGASGDFITSPDISQMFGELIGLWCVDCWSKLGCPQQFTLCEIGPGRGTLMQDALRSSKIVPEFQKAAQITLIEQSARLQKQQQQALQNHNVTWLSSVQELPVQMPLIVFGNELLDALPIRQFVIKNKKWLERRVALNGDAFEFCEGEISDTEMLEQLPPCSEFEEGDIYELNPLAREIISHLSQQVAQQKGYALFIDYGPEDIETGDSFQAIKSHKYVNPLENPGTSDLTSHVRFAQLSKLAQQGGCKVSATTSQGRFLERLGIEARAMILSRNADESQKQKIAADLRRLVSSEEMGTLFKAFSFHAQESEPPAGFTE